MKKKLARLSRFLNEQTIKNSAISSFYTGTITIVISYSLYLLLKLMIGSSFIQYIAYGILIYVVTSLTGVVVIMILDGFFNK